MADIIDIEAELVRETNLALLLRVDPDREPVWVPKSAVEYDRTDKVVTLPTAMAEEKGMF
ncbi:hypothetical protein [Roseicyclus sp.]|uniref:hypothetical protein n=1 Tax=Roseicyclus sp. TaxID=1914329 RepID=UPI003F6D6BE8